MVQNMLVLLTAALKDRKGVSSLEYAVLASGVIAALVAALVGFNAGLSGAFAAIITQLTNAT